MFGFLFSLFNSDNSPVSNCDENEEIRQKQLLNDWNKNNDWRYDNQDEDLWDDYLGKGYDYDDDDY